MMMQISFHDVENLSASLDGQLSQAGKTRLESRLKTEPELATALDELRQARLLLRRTPQRRAPRSFTLTPKMAGIRPPVPRLVPAFSWASAVAVLLFVCTLGTNLVGRFSFGAAAPMMASAPETGYGGGPPAEVMATEAPASDSTALTVTPVTFTLLAPDATPAPEARDFPPPDEPGPKQSRPVNPWLVIWPVLAVVLIGSALLLRWAGILAFRRKSGKK